MSKIKEKTQNAFFQTTNPTFDAHPMDGKSLVLPALNIDKVSEHARFLILSLPNNEMLQKSPFAIHKAIQGISGEPKSIKKLRSGDLLIETSALQTKSLVNQNIFRLSVNFSTFSTSSSSTQDNLLPSPSGILPTIQSESLLQIPIPTTSPGNNLNTLVSPLETETPSRTPPAKLNSVSTENLHESVPNESNSEHSTAAEAQQIVKRKSRNRRKRPKIQKPDIEIKRVPHRSRNAIPTEITDDEDMITYTTWRRRNLSKILSFFLKVIYAH
ncbi:hypothetical protein TNCV_990471 [Trichonephila clavipes]|nr:hypothetical protein TNCV_990471 [Trichonephila clavipes]